ncbi:MAG: hypothetical protein HPY85_05430 [Anaerolineae bacterium]|nr:hypothetical protein [Anaerolineae bacterium]
MSDLEMTNNPETNQTNSQHRHTNKLQWLWLIVLAAVVIGGAALRFVGMKWDEDQYLHPDERFLMFVVSSIRPNEEPGNFFNTQVSTMNPENVGYTFYVYGTLPLFITRFVASQLGESGWDIYIVGRYLSAFFDVLTILITYLIGKRLFKFTAIGVMAAAFYAFAVLPIQLSHYFTVDIQANFFSMAALYFAVLVMTQPGIDLSMKDKKDLEDNISDQQPQNAPDEGFWLGIAVKYWDRVLPYVAFGIAFGMAMACKISALPIAGLVAAAAGIRWLQLPSETRRLEGSIMMRHLVVAGVVSIIVFRICQPYAFEGPGFFGFVPNQEWINDLRSLSGQSKGEVDFPPALQWSRRPLSFGFTNLTIWGLGLPLGILAWAGFLLMLWRMIKGRWYEHLLLWGWTAVYFTWQLTNFTSSMRYFMQIYSPLCIIGAWLVVDLWKLKGKRELRIIRWNQVLAAVLGVVVIVATAGWGFAFSRIYTRSVTRVEASRWYYQNIEGPVNVKIQTDNGERQQILPYEPGRVITGELPLVYQWQPAVSGAVARISFDHVRYEGMTGGMHAIKVVISTDPGGSNVIGFGELYSEMTTINDSRGDAQLVPLLQQAEVTPGQTYYLVIRSESADAMLKVTGSIGLEIREQITSQVRWHYLPEAVEQITQQSPRTYTLIPKWTGTLDRITVPHISDVAGSDNDKLLQLTIRDYRLTKLGTSMIVNAFPPEPDGRGDRFELVFPEPVKVEEGEVYTLEFQLEGEGGVAFWGNVQANESSWDDVVPQRMDGYDPFNNFDGVFRSDLNFEMYWDDNESKRDRFLRILDEADIIMITSNRQWGTTTRVPERYPMTTLYYRELIGCPMDEDILVCYANAKPGMYSGNLGFELIKVFQSNPNLGSFEINDQLAEEAFTVYDHPKVLIFKKSPAFDSEKGRAMFMQVDLDRVIHQVPADVPMKPANLLLPTDRLNDQRSGGTWSQLFPPESLLNRYPWLALLVWYLSITVLGWIIYPFTRLVFNGLYDRGYAVSRLVGMLVLAWVSWMAGSVQIPVTRLTVWIILGVMVGINAWLLVRNREEIVGEVRQNARLIATIEMVAVAFFVAFLLVRLGNPDLWHPYKGGEKPMDFSYWNAVLKSTTFPPYDPWFSGGFINYYYYGFVIVGMPVKALGIMPSVAYNLVLPTLFSLFALAAFSLVYHLLRFLPSKIEPNSEKWSPRIPIIGGIFGAVLTLVIGNLGTIRMFMNGFIRLGGVVDTANASFSDLLAAFFRGIPELFRGNVFPFYPGDWYWIPSRTIPNEPITEFPYFTFLYADLHAHLLALPITLLVLVWCVSFLRGQWKENGRVVWGRLVSSLIFGSLAIGALRPTNTWDLPVYLILAVIVVAYSMFQHLELAELVKNRGNKKALLTAAIAIGSVVLLVFLAFAMYQPFADWYGQGYNSIKYWGQDTTPISSYVTHWGIFLFILLIWLGYESYVWMAVTPVSALKKLKKFQSWLAVCAAVLVVILIVLFVLKVHIGWIALLMAAWAGILLLRPDQPDLKRLVLFLMGTGLVLTLAVEVIVLEGDIGRMNTVFKFYLQAWVLLAIASAAGLGWMIPVMAEKMPKEWYRVFQAVLIALLFCGALYPIMASRDKITDRMAKDAPHVLDGMAYMQYAEYNDQGEVYSLAEDYAAIQWMQENVQGSPVIMEGNTVEYRWGNRYTIYTGLPSVVGWNWHQRQQRTVTPSTWVTDRVDDINLFYNTTDIETARDLLAKYDVGYIVVGRMEQVYYMDDGLRKFQRLEGDLWEVVFQQGQTSIYKVLQ